MLHRYLRNRRGVTLIEVITAMALMSLVTLMVFSFFSYGNAAFMQGKRQNEAQAELRIVNDYIVQEVRFATSFSLSSTHPGTIGASDSLDYIYLDGDRVVHSAYNSGNPRVVRQWGSGLLSTSSFWSAHRGDAQVLGITLMGENNGRTFDMNTSIELPNVALGNSHVADTAGARTISFVRNYTVTAPGTPPPPPSTYRLTASPSVIAGGTAEDVTPGGSGNYASGTLVSVLATENAGYRFDGWTAGGVTVSTDSLYSFNISSNTDLVAVFTQLNPPIVVDVTIVVERNNSANVQYRVTFGSLPTKNTTRSGSLHSATFPNVIGGEVGSGVTYNFSVELQDNKGNWKVVHTSTLLVQNEDLVHKVYNND
jgi:prepilin-type N-terminal cleavage/methylation domain-containing protein